MSTTIEWTHVPGYRGDVWNPTTGCNKVSQGCKHCYAETMHRRLHAMGVKGYERPFLEGARPVTERLHKPLRTKTPTAYFVNSMSDLFDADVPFSYIDQVFAVMALCPQHLFLILTKRPERMSNYLRGDGDHTTGNHYDTRNDIRDSAWARIGQMQIDVATDHDLAITRPGHPIPSEFTLRQQCAWPLPNVWLGTSVEDQATADARIPHLLRCPAAVRFLSCEPLLEDVNLDIGHPRHRTVDSYHAELHWVIAGGESGPKARPMHPDWARSLRDQCQAAGVPFFFKQWGSWGPVVNKYEYALDEFAVINGERWAMVRMPKSKAGRLLDGHEHNGWPKMITPEPVEA